MLSSALPSLATSRALVLIDGGPGTNQFLSCACTYGNTLSRGVTLLHIQRSMTVASSASPDVALRMNRSSMAIAGEAIEHGLSVASSLMITDAIGIIACGEGELSEAQSVRVATAIADGDGATLLAMGVTLDVRTTQESSVVYDSATKHSIIIVGSRRHKKTQSSFTKGLIVSTNHPVLSIHLDSIPVGLPQRVVVAVDGSLSSTAYIHLALSVTQNVKDSVIDLVNVGSDSTTASSILRSASQCIADGGAVARRTSYLEKTPHQSVAQVLLTSLPPTETVLLIVGTHGHGMSVKERLARLVIGSTADELISNASAVLLICNSRHSSDG